MEVTFDRYIIKRASYEDLDAIRKYVADNWRNGENHIMSRDRDFVEYELVDTDGQVNCILAIDAESGEIEGIFMYIYSSYTEGYRDIWGSLYSVRPGNNAWLGIELMKQIQVLSGCREYIGYGCNPNTSLKVAKVGLRRKPDKLVHYYALSDRDNDDFKIAKIVNRDNNTSKLDTPDNISVELITNPEDIKPFMDGRDKDIVPYKDYRYIEKRFFGHPIYKYDIYAVKKDAEIKAIFVVRKQEHDGRIALRMVDFVGDRESFSYTGSFWKNMLGDGISEYADFYAKGFEPEYMEAAGFCALTEDDANVIPNYFSPYVCTNVDIWCHSKDGNVFLCKGDGDQDRPG